MIDSEEIQELSNDREQEHRQDEQHERDMHDLDFALEYMVGEIQDAHDILAKVSKVLSGYGHEMSVYEILESL